MLSKDRVDTFIRKPLEAGLTRSEQMEMATELLSLREQLAELKALPPSFYVLKTAYADAWGDACDLRCYEDETDVSKAKDDFGGVIIPLFTAAKPAAGLGVEDITEFMRKAFWRGFESARGTKNSNIPADWKDSKPNLLLALKAKMSGA